MLPRWFGASRFFAFAWLIWMGAACRAQSTAVPAAAQALPPAMLTNLGRASLPIETWSFHAGDDLAWAAPGFDDSGWAQIHAGRSWEGQGYRGMTGFGWYRRRIEVPENAPKNWTLALYLDDVDSSCEVYWNGVKLGEVGRVAPHALWYLYSGPRVIRLGKAASGELAIRVWRSPRFLLSNPEEGGLEDVPRLGDAAALQTMRAQARLAWLKSEVTEFAAALLAGVVAVLALLAWFKNRKRRMLLWLALTLAFPLARLLIEIPGWGSYRLFYGTIGLAVGVHDLASWWLLIALLGLEDRLRLVRWTRVWTWLLILLAPVDSILMLCDLTPAWAGWFLFLDVTTTIPAVLVELWGVAIAVAALRRRQNGTRWFLATSVILVELLRFYSNLDLGSRWTHFNPEASLTYTLFNISGVPVDIPALLNLLLFVATLFAAWRYMEEAGARQRALEQEYRSAQELQRVLVPEAPPALAGCTVASIYRPAQEVGGDFFQVIPLADGATVLVIGDVSGKGLHAAMTVALIVGAIRSIVETTEEPAAILTALNRRLHGRLRGGFATCLAARVNSNGNCTLANAGHLPPFLNSNEVKLEPALPLGIVAEAEYTAEELMLEAGDRLTLYTDGLLEARNAEGELFGFERVREWSARPTEEIAAEAQRFGQEDDITVLTLEMAPVEVAHA